MSSSTVKDISETAPAPEPGPTPSAMAKTEQQEPVAPPNTARYLPGLLGLTPPCLVRVLEHLRPLDGPLQLSISSKTVHALMKTEVAFVQFWRSVLYSKQIDYCGNYQVLSAARRELVEQHFGPMAVVAALACPDCAECGSFTSNFNLLACARSCVKCWQCTDSAANGRNSASPFALCSASFAKAHFLLTDGDLKRGAAISLSVQDPTRAHGLTTDKTTILLVRDAKRLSELRWGSAQALAAEKVRRWDSSSRALQQQRTVCLTNYVCLNQAYAPMLSQHALYGLEFCIIAPDMLDASLPSIFVTHDTLAQVQAKHPHAAQHGCSIHANIIDAFVEAREKAGCCVVVDMAADLDEHYQLCDAVKCAAVLANRETANVGGTLQRNTILIYNDVKIVGTDRCCITSTTACFWVCKNALVEMHQLDLETNSVVSPTLVLCGFSKLVGCEVNNTGSGYGVLLHGQRNELVDCAVRSNSECVHVKCPCPLSVDAVILEGCDLIYGPQGLDWAIIDECHTVAEANAWVMESELSNDIEQEDDDDEDDDEDDEDDEMAEERQALCNAYGYNNMDMEGYGYSYGGEDDGVFVYFGQDGDEPCPGCGRFH